MYCTSFAEIQNRTWPDFLRDVLCNNADIIKSDKSTTLQSSKIYLNNLAKKRPDAPYFFCYYFFFFCDIVCTSVKNWQRYTPYWYSSQNHVDFYFCAYSPAIYLLHETKQTYLLSTRKCYSGGRTLQPRYDNPSMTCDDRFQAPSGRDGNGLLANTWRSACTRHVLLRPICSINRSAFRS